MIAFEQPYFLFLLLALPFLWMRRAFGWALFCGIFLVLGAAAPLILRWPSTPETVHIRNADNAPRALLEAGSRIARPGGGRVVFHGSEGALNDSFARAAERLFARGIPVELDLQPATLLAPRLMEIKLPPSAGIGETIPLVLRIDAPKADDVEIVVEPGGIRERLVLRPGQCFYTLDCVAERLGVQDFTVRMGEHSIHGAVAVHGAYTVRLHAPEDARARLVGLLGNSAVLTENDTALLHVVVEPDRLPSTELREVAEAARRGAGVLVFTGRRAPLNADASFLSMLPVEFERETIDRQPTVSLAIIIDTSGSMSGARIDLAREVARLALETLSPADRAGIVEFHGRRRWAAPMQSAANRIELNRALNRLNAGGGTVILPAMQEAYYALRNSNTRLKHVLVITDGGVERGPFESLVFRMREQGITLSTVMIGVGDGAFLSRLAGWGNGKFYQVSGRFSLPELTFRQSGRNTLPQEAEGMLASFRADGGESLPVIGGMLRSAAKPGSDVLVLTQGMPLIATRTYGLGRVGVVNSDFGGTWSAGYFRDSSGSAFLAGLARSLARRDIVAENRSAGTDLHFEFHVADAPSSLNVILNEAETFLLRPDSRGVFRLFRPGLLPGTYRLRVVENNAEFACVLAPERLGLGDPALVREIERRSALLSGDAELHRPLSLRWVCCALAAACLLGMLLRRRLAPLALALFVAFPVLGGTDRLPDILAFEAVRNSGTLERLLTDPGENPVYVELAIAELEDRKQYAEALALLRRRAPHLQSALVRLAEKAGRPELVREIYAEWLRREPENLRIRLDAARFELLQGQTGAARKFLQDALERVAERVDLFELAATAEQCAFPDIAEESLRRVERPDDPYPARFRRAEFLRRTERPREALELLRSTSPDAPKEALMGVAERLERFGALDAALLFYDRVGNMDARIRAAMLLENQGDRRAAAERWLAIYRAGDGAMRTAQAMGRVVALYKADKRLAELPTAGESRRFQGTVLAASGDLPGLRALYAGTSGAERREELSFLIELKEYKLARELLETLDSDRMEMLRELAVLDLEAGDKDAALARAEALLALDRNAPGALEFAAGTAMAAGRFDQAIAWYGEGLARNPDRSELYLLRANALRAAGRQEDALAFFHSRLATVGDADTFGVMVDGLLNLRARVELLRDALRETERRIAVAPENIFLYTLAEDLAEECGDESALERIRQALLVRAPERRVFTLRLLLEGAQRRGDTENTLYYTRILLALGESATPDLYRELGERMLDACLYASAERCFRLADELADDSAENRLYFAAACRDRGLFGAARRVLRELAVLRSGDLELKQEYALLLELEGRRAEAARETMNALKLLVGRGPIAEERERFLLPFTRSLAHLLNAEDVKDVYADLSLSLNNAQSESQRDCFRAVKLRVDQLRGLAPLPVPKPPAKRVDVARPPAAPKALDGILALTREARELSQKGEGKKAFILAREAYDRAGEKAEFSISDLFALRELDVVFRNDPAAAKAFRASLEEDRAVLGDSARRALLAGLVDPADFFLLRHAWELERNSLAALRALTDASAGNEETLMQTLLAGTATNEVTRVIQLQRLLPLLRKFKRLEEGRRYLELVNETLRPREQLLLSLAGEDLEEQKRSLLLFGLSQRLRWGIGRLPADADRPYPSSVRPEIEYLLLALRPDEAGFLSLFEELRKLPVTEKDRIRLLADKDSSSPGKLAAIAAGMPGALPIEANKKIKLWTEDPAVPAALRASLRRCLNTEL